MALPPWSTGGQCRWASAEFSRNQPLHFCCSAAALTSQCAEGELSPKNTSKGWNNPQTDKKGRLRFGSISESPGDKNQHADYFSASSPNFPRSVCVNTGGGKQRRQMMWWSGFLILLLHEPLAGPQVQFELIHHPRVLLGSLNEFLQRDLTWSSNTETSESNEVCMNE